MQFLSLIRSFFLGFSNNVPLALLLLSLYLLNSYVIYNCSRLLYLHSNHRSPIFLTLALFTLWAYGEIRSAGVIVYSYDTNGFLFSSYTFIGSILVLFSTSALFGNILFLIFQQ